MENDYANNAVENEEEQPSRMRRKTDYRKRETRSWIFSLLAALAIALCLRFFVFEFIRVDGNSMETTLHNNEYVFMERVTFWFREPDFGDIIICTYPQHPDTYVKRVIGTGGDVIEISDGVLYINGEADYTYFQDQMNDFAPVVVPEGCVFVMGDNRNESLDSRMIGPLTYDRIRGKAEFVIWPIMDNKDTDFKEGVRFLS